MAEGKVKKLYIMQTLEVLKKYSDANHHLKQNDIIRYMKLEYDVECERKSVARNISNLQDLGYDIVKDNGYYLADRIFEESELRLLIDSIMASRYIPLNQSKELIDKLISQSSVYFKKQMRHVANLDRMNHEKSGQLFYNIDILNEAIDKHKKVTLFYNKKDVNSESKPTSSRPHLVNPYQIVVANGRYYLIANMDKYDNITHLRVEKISNIKLKDEPAKDIKKIKGQENGLNLPQHMVEHVYMYSGKSERITMKVKASGIDNVFDWLGDNITITPTEDEEYVEVSVRANLEAMKYWAIQFGELVEVVSPLELREEIKKSIKCISNKYD